ncbi:hypothetical protein QZH41_000938 [Actinostola sp. cb2023]|nr:hypothetical protein QZH41_000938 [Actinostola sp. cb2023]
MVVISSKARLSNQVGSTRLDKEFKTAKSLGVVTGSFVFCWLPFFILSLLYQYCVPCQTVITGIPAAASAVKWLHYLNSCLNPIIYAFLNPTFKVAFRNLFRRFCTNPNNFNDDYTVTSMIFPNSRRNASHRKKSNDNAAQSNGRIPNGKQKSRAKKRKLLRFKTPLEESLQDSYSENIDKRVNEQTYIENIQEEQPCVSTQPNGKESLSNNKADFESPTIVRPQRRVHYDDDEFLHVTDTDPLRMEADCSSILSDSNNNPSDMEDQSTHSNGYKPIDTPKTSDEKLYELDLPLSTNTDTSDISTYHDQESDQFYFYIDGEFISEKDIKTSNSSTPRYYGHLAITDTSLLRTPRYYGHLAITDTSLLRTPRYYGHRAITDTSLLRTPRYNGHLAITGTSLLRAPCYYGHLTITDTPLLRTPRYYGLLAITDTPLLGTLRYYGHLAITDTSLLRTPRYYGHPAITDSSLLRTPRYYGHLAITDTSLLRTPRYYGHPAITDSSLLRTPRCYGHLAITDTSLLRTPRYYGHPAIRDTSLLRAPRYYGHLAITDTPLLRTPRYYGHLAITDTSYSRWYELL